MNHCLPFFFLLIMMPTVAQSCGGNDKTSDERGSKGEGVLQVDTPTGDSEIEVGEDGDIEEKDKTELYERLCISKEATQKEIEAAYKQQKKEHRVTNPNQQMLSDDFKKILFAYKILSNKKTRKLYDENGHDVSVNEGYLYLIKPKSVLDFCKVKTPRSLADINPNFKVYVRGKKRLEQKIADEAEVPGFIRKLKEADYLKITRRFVFFIIHGFMGRLPFARWPFKMKKRLLEKEDATVFIVEWPKGAHVPYSYHIPLYNTQTIGNITAALAVAINHDVFGGNHQTFYLHCIGHSLGAHICGQAGRQSKNTVGVHLFDRITGLEPAGPGFEECPQNTHLRIGPDSGECVENIHTDGTTHKHWFTWLVAYFGTLEPWGHIDFYPNGGGNQPGCIQNDLFPGCSHLRSIVLFRYSIEKDENAAELISQKICEADEEDCEITQSLGYYSSCHHAKPDTQKKVQGQFNITTDIGKGLM